MISSAWFEDSNDGTRGSWEVDHGAYMVLSANRDDESRGDHIW